jgi:hypothetical protein
MLHTHVCGVPPLNGEDNSAERAVLDQVTESIGRLG